MNFGEVRIIYVDENFLIEVSFNNFKNIFLRFYNKHTPQEIDLERKVDFLYKIYIQKKNQLNYIIL
jgi:hypothetical protein